MSKHKVIWIVNYYAAVPCSETNPRYTKLSHYFQQAGYDVYIFNASFDHRSLTDLIPDKANYLKKQYGIHNYVHIRTPHYHGNGISRVFSIFVFAWRLLLNRKHFEKPDVILHNLHTPFDYPIVWVSKLLRCKYIAEAWDLWPDDFVEYGLVSKKNPVLKLFYAIEKRLYYHADQMIFTFKGIYDYLEHKGWTLSQGGKINLNHVHYINNGIDIAEFDQNRLSYPRQDDDMNNPDIYKIVYMGSVSLANDVKQFVDAASLLQHNPKYKFFIYGNGSDRPFLEQYVIDNGISNVVFKEKRIPLREVAWVVSQARVNVMNYTKGFGRLGVSSGKLFQYLAAGKPIVCNVKIDYDDVITDNNLGVAYDMYSADDYAQAIQRLAEQSDSDYESMCQRVRSVGAQFDYALIAKNELSVIELSLQSTMDK
ncbi:MAG: glycosyltransferase family 4 protein [Bacteroidales bacterium]|nr:glycosyltransferase family 4 protein [Candidatus Colimorpha onthohippi]